MRTIKILFCICILAMAVHISPENVHGSQEKKNEKVITFVNPVRGRDRWLDKSLNPLATQHALLEERGFRATWLLQYDALEDDEVVDTIKNWDGTQELGLFLEISPKLAQDARVIYPHAVAWDDPNAVFLSGYSQSDRKKLIDTVFDDHKSKFGEYPKSVGAWWIDSYSLDYIVKKYDIEAALIVADQRTTDDYGVWGQWWGVPYYPSKVNILTPASNLENKQDVVITQWAQRDLTKAYGDGPTFSNYSLQANDYLERGFDTGYFIGLTDTYLNCGSLVCQITVGLETGMESVSFIDEYTNQLDYLSLVENAKSVTMNEFASIYRNYYPELSGEYKFADDSSEWILKRDYRENILLGDRIEYYPNISFFDYYTPDKSDFLNRVLPSDYNQVTKVRVPWFLLFIIGGLFIFIKLKKVGVWVASMLYLFAAYGLILRSRLESGWFVYYGPKMELLEFTQMILAIFSMLFIYFLYKLTKDKLFILLTPLVFGFSLFIGAARYTFMEGKHYVGFAVDALRFVGIRFSNLKDLKFVNQDLLSYQAAALLRFDYDAVWDNIFTAVIVLPLAFVVIAVVLNLILKILPRRIVLLALILMIILYTVYILTVFGADPRVLVTAIN